MNTAPRPLARTPSSPAADAASALRSRDGSRRSARRCRCSAAIARACSRRSQRSAGGELDVQVAGDVTDAARSPARSTRSRAAGRPTSILVNNAGEATARRSRRPTTRSGSDDRRQPHRTFNCIARRAARHARGEGRTHRQRRQHRGARRLSVRGRLCAAKHGVVGLTRALALELAGTRVTVNAVCPGYTDTDLVRDAVANIVAKTGKHRRRRAPRSRRAIHSAG